MTIVAITIMTDGGLLGTLVIKESDVVGASSGVVGKSVGIGLNVGVTIGLDSGKGVVVGVEIEDNFS